MNLTLTIPESTQPPITVTVGGTTGGATELTSYETQVESLPDYPDTFPPDLTGVTPADIGAVQSNITGIAGADAITNVVSLTQAEYDAIGTPDASTLYVITS
jgi:hypothetical protein